MRTIRIKLYKFAELSASAKQTAILNEVRRFDSYFSIDSKITDINKLAALKRIEAYGYEFTKDGKLNSQ